MNLKYTLKSDYNLEDERVLLRPLQESDLKYLLPFAINEPETWKYSQRSAKGLDGMKHFIATSLIARDEGREYPFIIYDKQQEAFAGSTRFYDIQVTNQTLQLGYTWYGEQFRGTGLNKHCKFLLLQLAFETLDAERVEFRADARNELSIAAMKSIGCKVEGVLRSHLPMETGGRRDSIILSILKNEWFDEVKENLKSKL